MHIPSRTWSGRTGTARSATRPWAGCRFARAAVRTCPSPAGPPSTSGMAGSRTRSCPRCATRITASWSRRTTGSRPRTIPTTSPATISTDTGPNGSRSCWRPSPEHDLESFEAMQTDMLSLPGLETAGRLARLRPRDQRERSAIERLRSWDGRMSPDSIAATIYQAFTLRLGREVTRAAIQDRDLSERWLDRADNGFIAHVTSPWRWQSHLLALWAEGDEELVGRPWDELVLDALRGALDDLESRFGLGPDGWRWGKVHPLVFAHALGAASPLRRWASQPPARGRGRPGDGCPGGLGPQRPVHRDLGALLADGRRPGAARALPLAGVHRPVRAGRQPSLRRPPGRLARWANPADGGRGPVAHARIAARGLLVSTPGAAESAQMSGRRAEIQLSPDEQRELIESERIIVVSTLGPRGWPHSMPLWYVPRDGEIWIYTYAKSQKVRNLERDPRATLLVETGHEYGELRGIEIEAVAGDPPRSRHGLRARPGAHDALLGRGRDHGRRRSSRRSGPRPASG